jgi:WD40 repeat protein
MYNVDWSPDGDLLVSAGLQGDVIIWDPTDLSIRRRLPSPEWVIGVKFTPDGTRLLTAGGSRAAGSRDRVVQIWAVPPWWRRFFNSR